MGVNPLARPWHTRVGTEYVPRRRMKIAVARIRFVSVGSAGS